MQTTASTCQGCLANCSIRITTEDGHVRGICGNTKNAGTQGAVCPNVRMLDEQRRDPDRVLYPLRRTNPRKGRGEDPRFERITWDEALDEIADRLMALRRQGQGHRVAFAKGRATGIGGLLTSALPAIYGTPNRLSHDGICAEAEKLATGSMDGVFDYHDYDLAHTRYVLMWGTDPLAGNRMKARFMHDFADLKRRATITVVSPHRSVTAQAARNWVAVVPGADGALACAIAHVILTEGLWNRSYVGDFKEDHSETEGSHTHAFRPGKAVDPAAFRERHTHGLVTWWNSALKDATPEWAQPLCQVEAARIRAIAREFAAAGQRAVSWTSPGVAMSARGLYATMACYALNGLVGSIGAEGGVLRFPKIPVAALPSTEPFLDDIARAANTRPVIDGRDDPTLMAAKGTKVHANQVTNHIAEGILSDDPYPLDMMIAYWVNWAYSCTGAQRWEQALAKLPFFAYVTTHLSETAMFADIVLPARHHAFEDWGFARSRQGGVSCVTVEQPSVESPGECKGDETEFPFMLAEKLSQRGFDAPLRYFQSITSPFTGAAPENGRELAEYATARMTEPLWSEEAHAPLAPTAAAQPSPDATRQAAWQRFLTCGTWCSEPTARRKEGEDASPLPTPTGQFEFESEHLRKLFAAYANAHSINPADVAAALGYEARGERALVPHFEPPVRLGNAQEFPLVLHQHRSRLSLEGRAANTPRFQKLKGTDPGDAAWDDVIKLHPHDMQRFGLADGETVRVTSTQGSITCRARTWDGTLPGVAVKCYGQGHWAYGHVAALDFERHIPRGGNNNEIIAAEYEHASGATARHGGLMRIRIERA